MRRHVTFLKYNQDGVFSLIVYSLFVTLIHATLRNANKNDSSSLCLLKKNFMVPFYGWGSTTSRREPLRGGSLLFTTKSPEIFISSK